MCGDECSSTTNTGSDNTYSVSNLGAGFGLYAGDVISGNNTDFTFKSLLAGTGMSIISTSNTLTLSSDGATSVTNLGSGSQVLVDVLANSVRARSLVGQRGMGVNQPGNTITFDCNLITSNFNTVFYKYLLNQGSVSLAPSYNTPLGAISNSGNSNSGYNSTINVVAIDLIDFLPGPRQVQPTLWPFTTTDTAFNTNCSFINLVPDLSYAYDPRHDYLVGSDASSGNLWLINTFTQQEERLAYYDGDVVNISNAYGVAVDIADALIFYSEADKIFVHDYVTKSDIFSFSASQFQLWPVGATVACLYFDQEKNTLTVMSSIATNRLWSFSIPAYDRYGVGAGQLNMTLGAISVSPIPIPVGSTPDQLITNNYQQVFATSITAVNTLIGMYNSIGSGSNALSITGSIEAQTDGYALCNAASGRIYLISRNTNRIYRSEFGDASVITGFPNTGGVSQTYRCLTRCPYGPRQSI